MSPERRPVFSAAIDALIREIDAAGGAQELWRYLYRQRRQASLEQIERDLRQMRERYASDRRVPH
ncbi:MAG TPA: hypothetical protein VGW38_17090 [Chloroflexota bacterium]|nr:hypothetical protein [Chloroflexota bacterium]